MIAPRREVLEGWARSNHARSWVYRPRSVEEAARALEDAAERDLTVVHRGSGLSYGDAALNQGGAVVDTTALHRVVTLDAERGRIRVEAGATVEDVWRAVLPHGWWPCVVPGSMQATVGGCVAMDVHGKNHPQRGSFGEQVEAVTLLEPSGSTVTLDAHRHGARLARVVGAQGLTGTILDVTLRLDRVHSGYLEIESLSTPTLEATLLALDARGQSSDYAVGWVDCLAPARARGRGLLHFARYVPQDHSLSGRGLTLAAQRLPSRILGVLPRVHAWRALRPFVHEPGMRLVNAGRYWSGRTRQRHRYVQSHAAFHFLLDHVPGWRRVYGAHGFIQYQLFVPEDSALYALGEALRLMREARVPAYLGVLKRHRAGRFAAPYALDGYSLALDLPVRLSRLAGLQALCRSYDALLLEVGGRVYAAKDSVSAGTLPEARHPLFSSNLVRRWERSGARPHA